MNPHPTSPRPGCPRCGAAFKLAAAGLAALAATGIAWAQTQVWNYKSYQRDPASGQYSKDRYRTTTIELTERDGKASFRMVTAGKGDVCFSRSDLPAEVERGPDAITITVTPTVHGCEPFRYVIRNDGSGGVRLYRKGDNWIPDGFDHDLTPAK
jgi:hypothetical protein